MSTLVIGAKMTGLAAVGETQNAVATGLEARDYSGERSRAAGVPVEFRSEFTPGDLAPT